MSPYVESIFHLMYHSYHETLNEIFEIYGESRRFGETEGAKGTIDPELAQIPPPFIIVVLTTYAMSDIIGFPRRMIREG
jgi:hypothetical protein